MLRLKATLEDVLGEPDTTLEFEGGAEAVKRDDELDGDAVLDSVTELQGLADAVALLQGDTLAEGVGDRERVTEPVAELQALPLRDRVLVTVGELEAQPLALVVTVGLAVPLKVLLGHLETGADGDRSGVLEGDTLADADPESPMVEDGLALTDPVLLRDRVFVTVSVPDAHDVGDKDAAELALLQGVGAALPLAVALGVRPGEGDAMLDPESAALAEKREAVTDKVAELHRVADPEGLADTELLPDDELLGEGDTVRERVTVTDVEPQPLPLRVRAFDAVLVPLEQGLAREEGVGDALLLPGPDAEPVCVTLEDSEGEEVELTLMVAFADGTAEGDHAVKAEGAALAENFDAVPQRDTMAEALSDSE